MCRKELNSSFKNLMEVIGRVKSLMGLKKMASVYWQR